MAYESYRAGMLVSRDAIQIVSRAASNHNQQKRRPVPNFGHFAPIAVAGPPVPSSFKTYGDFAIAVLNNQWDLSAVNGCAYYNAAAVATGNKKYIYVATGNIHRAYWVWDAVYPVLPGVNMGTFMTEDEANKNGYACGMHLVVPDTFKSDGGFSNFPY